MVKLKILSLISLTHCWEWPNNNNVCFKIPNWAVFVFGCWENWGKVGKYGFWLVWVRKLEFFLWSAQLYCSEWSNEINTSLLDRKSGKIRNSGICLVQIPCWAVFVWLLWELRERRELLGLSSLGCKIEIFVSDQIKITVLNDQPRIMYVFSQESIGKSHAPQIHCWPF